MSVLMSVKSTAKLLCAALCLASLVTPARAAAKKAAAHKHYGPETDVALSGYGWLNTTSNLSSGLTQIPANSVGGMLEVRHISTPLIGYEVSFGYNRANQEYSNPISCPGASCPLTPYAASVSASATQVLGNWVFTFPLKGIHFFALGGGGLILFQPSQGTLYSYSLQDNPAFQNSTAPTSGTSAPAFDYGIGVDWALWHHLGARFQYRGLYYKSPALTSSFSSTQVFTQSYEPMVGVTYRF